MGVHIKLGMGPIEPPGCVATKGTNLHSMRDIRLISYSSNKYVAIKALTKLSAHSDPALSGKLSDDLL